jgi:hypothetical protein
MSADALLTELLAALDNEPDELHGDITPAVIALVKLGWPAAPGLLERMLAESADTRLHAQRAFEGILMHDFGFVRGRGFARPEDEQRLRKLWVAHGDYAYDDDKAQRSMAVGSWRRWLKEHGHD